MEKPINFKKIVVKKKKFGEFKCPYCFNLYSESTFLIWHLNTHKTESVIIKKEDKVVAEPIKAFSSPCKDMNKLESLAPKPSETKAEASKRKSSDEGKVRNLKLNGKTRTSERKVNCPKCRKMFTNLSCLKVHFRIHSGKKPFTCEFCSKSFNQKETLIRHVRTHTGEKPFKCPWCSYKCSVKSNLKPHIVHFHKISK